MRARYFVLGTLGITALASSCVGDAASDAASDEAATSTGTTTSADADTSETSDTLSTTDGPAPVCGDGHVDAGEECDDANSDSNDACTDTCMNAVCGDGLVHVGIEACDDGNADEDDGCSSACELVASCTGGFCRSSVESCPLAAQVNAAVEGETPLGPFQGTFAAFSGALAFGQLGSMVILPEYVDGDLCQSPARLQLVLGEAVVGPTYAIEAPARFHDGQGAYVDALASVSVHACCNTLWFCECASPNPFWIDLVIEGEGWSLAGTAAPNCCRSYSVDEGA